MGIEQLKYTDAPRHFHSSPFSPFSHIGFLAGCIDRNGSTAPKCDRLCQTDRSTVGHNYPIFFWVSNTSTDEERINSTSLIAYRLRLCLVEFQRLRRRESGGRGNTNWSVGGNGRFALLLIVLGVWILASADGGFVDLDARVAVSHHQASVCGGFFAVFGDFGFHDRLD